MNCQQFRQAVTADPALASAAVLEHRQSCPDCAAWADRLRSLDGLIGRALAIDLPARAAPTAIGARPAVPAVAPPRRHTRGWLALAASMVLGLAIGTGLWLSYPRDSLASEVVSHIKHEPQALLGTEPLPAEQVAGVLGAFGLRLKPEAGPVSYSSRCFWQRHWVPHLVVRTASGPVTVFVLAHRHVDAEQRFDTEGYSGVVLPAPTGSIAVIGRDVAGLAAIAQQVYQSIEWGATAPAG